jgi:hypothetical protein
LGELQAQTEGAYFMKRRDPFMLPSRATLPSDLEGFHVGTPEFVDLAFDFESRRAGFDGL